MRTSVYHRSKSVVALAPNAIAVNGTTNGATVDLLQGGAGDFKTALLVVQSRAIGEGSHAVTFEHSDNGTVWSAAGDAVTGTLGTFTATDDNVIREVGYSGAKRYFRIVVTTTGITTGNGVLGAVAVLYDTAGFQR